MPEPSAGEAASPLPHTLSPSQACLEHLTEKEYIDMWDSSVIKEEHFANPWGVLSGALGAKSRVAVPGYQAYLWAGLLTAGKDLGFPHLEE